MKAGSSEARELKRILDVYEAVSGQMINKDKSSVLFSPNTTTRRKEYIKTTLSITQETMGERYLGLPVSVGKSRKRTFSYLKQRIWSKIQGW